MPIYIYFAGFNYVFKLIILLILFPIFYAHIQSFHTFISFSSIIFIFSYILSGVELLMDAIKKAGYEKEVKIGMDVAASEFLLPSGNAFKYCQILPNISFICDHFSVT